MRIAFLGPAGTYGEQAAVRLAALEGVSAPDLQPQVGIRAVVRALADGDCDAAVVPVENSVEGGVTACLDALWEHPELRVARALAAARPVRILTTFLGAHAVPQGMDADSYIGSVCIPALHAAHAEGLVDAVDAFCEGIAFSPAQVARVFDRARALGLPVKLHAEQLSNLGGAALAARHGALSADHLEYLDEDGVRAMAAAGTVAVILPGAFYTLRETQSPPIDLLRRHGVPMAVATDCNPGSSPMTSLTLAMNMACTLFRMTPQEALLGTTAHAARALGLSDRGRIAAGQRADLAVWDATHPAELSYRIGATPLHARIIGGRLDA
jgi:imidazolonepropionase